jgi:hypothetical protein
MLAKVLKEKGIEGIFFDNEEYRRPLFNYPEDCSDPSKSLQEYQDQARLRGRQIMQAIGGEYPQIVFVVLHGPYSSCSSTPENVRGGATKWQLEELRGPFSVGLIEGLANRSRFVDGGEIYGYRTADDFQVSYDFRKYGIASPETNCSFISNYLRSVWPLKVSIAFGVYNHPFAGQAMTPAILRSTLKRALQRCDDYVWLYFEKQNWYAPGEIPQEWVDAVVAARAAAANPPTSPPPSVSITNPMVGSVFRQSAIIPITANASAADGTISKVEFFDGTEKLGEAVSAPHSFSWTGAVAGTHVLTAKATDDHGATTISSQVPITVTASFSANINFQIAGITPPVGYSANNGDAYGDRGNGLIYGWNVSHVGNTRNRGGSADLRLSTLCQFQSGGVWELAVPNGVYNVSVGIGDGGYPSTYTINVEGVNYWNAQRLSAGQFINRTREVNVSDGNLTIDQGSGGFEETRINYVLVAPATQPSAPSSDLAAATPSLTTTYPNSKDTTNPAASVSIIKPMARSIFGRSVSVPVIANASDAGGRITKVEFFDGAEKLGEAVRVPYSFSWASAAAGTHVLTAKATDNHGATAISNQVPIVVTASFSTSINFQVAGITPPIGYFADYGELYGDRGNGLTYGWNVSHVANARNRGGSAGLRLSTLCQFQSGGVWELAVPNDAYNVTVGIGDGNYPSTYTINVEGVNYWSSQGLSAGEFINRTRVVNVSDGNLTIDQGAGGFEETRINYVLVAPATALPAGSSDLTAKSPSSTTMYPNSADKNGVEHPKGAPPR